MHIYIYIYICIYIYIYIYIGDVRTSQPEQVLKLFLVQMASKLAACDCAMCLHG